MEWFVEAIKKAVLHVYVNIFRKLKERKKAFWLQVPREMSRSLLYTLHFIYAKSLVLILPSWCPLDQKVPNSSHN